MLGVIPGNARESTDSPKDRVLGRCAEASPRDCLQEDQSALEAGRPCTVA